MSREIGELIEPFQTAIREVIKRANNAGINAFVTDTTRTIEEQRELVRKGYSYTMDSKHLTGEAADIAFLVDGKLSYDRQLYKKLYLITQDIPFVIWPYSDLGWNWDYPHHQYDKNKKVGYNTDMTGKQESDYQQRIKVLEQIEREQNTEIGRVTEERDTARTEKDEEIKAKLDVNDKWQGEIEKKNRAIESLKYANDKLEGVQDVLNT